MAYVDDALDAGLLHGLARRRLVHVLVVLPPALPRTEQVVSGRAPWPEANRSMVVGAGCGRRRPRTLGKTMSARLGVEIMSTSTSAGSPPGLLHGLPSSPFFTRYGTHLTDAKMVIQRQQSKKEMMGARNRSKDEFVAFPQHVGIQIQ